MMLTVRESATNLLNSQTAPVLKGPDGTRGSAIFTTADKGEYLLRGTSQYYNSGRSELGYDSKLHHRVLSVSLSSGAS